MKPKPLVALNHFTVPMLTGVVPSQDRYSRSPLSNGLVRSNFWKGRQRLNRLYRWIANVVRPKIDGLILFQSRAQNNPDVRDFLGAACFAGCTLCRLPCPDMFLSCAIWRQRDRGIFERRLAPVRSDQNRGFGRLPGGGLAR